MFKLNQFLLDNKLSSSTKLPLSISIKIIKIFNRLAQSSCSIANKLLQIIFNTKHFVESKSDGSNSAADISSKLKDLILSNNTGILNTAQSKKSKQINEATNNKFNVLVNYYLRVCDLTSAEFKNNKNSSNNQDYLSDNEDFSMFSSLIKNSNFVVSLFEFLFNLFKVKIQKILLNYL